MQKKVISNSFSLFWPAWGALLFIVLLRVLPFFDSEGRYWGFNHLNFLPDFIVVVFFLMAVIAVVVPLLDKSGIWGERLASGVNNFLYEHRRAIWSRLVLILLAGIVFAIFVAPTHFLGDGYVIKANVALGDRTIFKWTEVGSTFLVSSLAGVLGDLNESTSLRAFQIISILSGAMTLYFMILIAGKISNQPLIRLLALSTMIFSSTLLLFFGYVEFYPMLWPILTAIIWAGLGYLQEGKRLWLVWLLLAVGAGLHLIMAMLIPSAIYITLAAGRGKVFYEKHRQLIWTAIGIAIIASIITFIWRLNNSLSFEDMFLPPFEGKPSSPEYFIFSFRHLGDILNQLLLVFPLLPLFIILAFGGLRKTLREKATRFSLLVAFGFLAFLLVVDPKLGMPRDWDLFAMSAIGLNLFLILAAARIAVATLKRMAVAIVIVGLFCTVPYLVTNLTKSSSVAYAESLLNYETSRAMSGLVIFQDYYKKEGSPEKSKAIWNRHKHKFQEKGKIDAILEALNKGDLRTAGRILTILKPNKFNPDFYRVKARYELYFQHYDLALNHINNAIQLRSWYSEYYGERALIYFSMGRHDSALVDLRRAYKLDPNISGVANGLTGIYADANMFDSSSRYARELIALDSTDPMAYFALIKQGLVQGDTALVTRYHDKFRRYADSNLHYPLIQQIESLMSAQPALPR